MPDNMGSFRDFGRSERCSGYRKTYEFTHSALAFLKPVPAYLSSLLLSIILVSVLGICGNKYYDENAFNTVGIWGERGTGREQKSVGCYSINPVGRGGARGTGQGHTIYRVLFAFFFILHCCSRRRQSTVSNDHLCRTPSLSRARTKLRYSGAKYDVRV